MTVLIQIEHAIHDFGAWKAAFDGDPVDRSGSGVVRYRVFRPVDDPLYVAVDLEFDDLALARAFQDALHRMWATPVARSAFAGEPRSRIVEMVEAADL